MDFFVSAGEASSDIHCARLIRELKAKADISTFGFGGNELAKSNTRLLMHNEEMSGGGGPLELISQIPKRRRLTQLLRESLRKKRPDGAILVDTGEINLHLAPLLHSAQVPIVYYIPPKVWVWRTGRLNTIAKHIDLVLSILPFEEHFYRAHKIPFEYVGNPLLDEVPQNLTETEAKSLLRIEPHRQVLTVMPGSRPTEIRWQLELFVEAVKVFLNRLPGSETPPLILMPAAQAIEPASIEEAFRNRLPGIPLQVVKEQSHACMKAARVALIKSGTSTLEAALLQVPMVLAYHGSRSAEWFFRNFVRYRGFVGLVNLFLEPNSEAALGVGPRPVPVVPEMVLGRCKPELIAQELIAIYRDGPERDRMLKALAQVPPLLSAPSRLGKSPMQAAANSAWGVLARRHQQRGASTAANPL